jgi:hypothetical protein
VEYAGEINAAINDMTLDFPEPDLYPIQWTWLRKSAGVWNRVYVASSIDSRR